MLRDTVASGPKSSKRRCKGNGGLARREEEGGADEAAPGVAVDELGLFADGGVVVVWEASAASRRGGTASGGRAGGKTQSLVGGNECAAAACSSGGVSTAAASRRDKDTIRWVLGRDREYKGNVGGWAQRVVCSLARRLQEELCELRES